MFKYEGCLIDGRSVTSDHRYGPNLSEKTRRGRRTETSEEDRGAAANNKIVSALSNQPTPSYVPIRQYWFWFRNRNLLALAFSFWFDPSSFLFPFAHPQLRSDAMLNATRNAGPKLAPKSVTRIKMELGSKTHKISTSSTPSPLHNPP